MPALRIYYSRRYMVLPTPGIVAKMSRGDENATAGDQRATIKRTEMKHMKICAHIYSTRYMGSALYAPLSVEYDVALYAGADEGYAVKARTKR